VRKGAQWPGKPDKHATVTSLYTAADGPHVRHGSDGSVRMSTPARLAECGEEERLICGRAVVVFYRGGARKVLFADGDVQEQLAAGAAWQRSSLRDSQDGSRSVARDPESKATVLRRASGGGVTLAVLPDAGGVLVTHADGTRIWSQAGVIRFEAEGLGTVKLLAEEDATAYKHSRGGRVDISRSSRAVRSSTLLPDATVVHIEYDTRVTAKVNGSLRLLKPDSTAVEAADDGSVVWRPWDVNDEQRKRRALVEAEEERKQLPASAREEPDRLLACYYIQPLRRVAAAARLGEQRVEGYRRDQPRRAQGRRVALGRAEPRAGSCCGTPCC
jgi:hypothetical protein